MKVLVTGAGGQLGIDVVQLLSRTGHEVCAYKRCDLDVTSVEQTKRVIKKALPDAVIHCAAYTNVDLAETEVDRAFAVNVNGTRNMVCATKEVGAKFLYVSTDYVFDGLAVAPLTEGQATAPCNVYGKSKRMGERVVRQLYDRAFIVRTSWLYGLNGNNFVKTMLNLAQTREEVTVVSDQVGCPTYTVDLAQVIVNLMETEKYGLYHVSNRGECSWYQFAKEIFRQLGQQVDVRPCTSEQFPRPAVRPKYTVLAHRNLDLNGFAQMRDWEEALREFLDVLSRSV